MKTQHLSARHEQYINAPRALDVEGFPTPGYYFIRGIRVKEDGKGNKFSLASVNWKAKEEEAWEDMVPGNHFKLCLKDLFSYASISPDKALKVDDLRHKFINIKSAKVTPTLVNGVKTNRICVEWEVINYIELDRQHGTLEALPYYNMFSPLILAMEDEKLDAENVDELAAAINSQEQLEYEDEPIFLEKEAQECIEDEIDETLYNDESETAPQVG